MNKVNELNKKPVFVWPKPEGWRKLLTTIVTISAAIFGGAFVATTAGIGIFRGAAITLLSGLGGFVVADLSDCMINGNANEQMRAAFLRIVAQLVAGAVIGFFAGGGALGVTGVAFAFVGTATVMETVISIVGCL